MKVLPAITSQLLSLSLYCLPIAKAEENNQVMPNAPKENLELTKSAEALTMLKKFEETGRTRNFDILKAAKPEERVRLLQEQEKQIIQVINSLAKLYNLPVTDPGLRLTPANFQTLTEPLITEIFKDKQTILFPRSLIINEEEGVILYTLPVTIAEKYQERVIPREYQIAGLLNDNNISPVSFHQTSVPFFEVMIAGPHEAIISQVAPKDYSLTNKTGAVIFKDRLAGELKAASKGVPAPIEKIEHALAVRITTFAMTDMSPEVPPIMKFEGKEFQKVQLGQLFGDYKFLNSTKSLGLEFLVYDLQIAEKTKDPQYQLSLLILKKALENFITEQDIRGSHLNTLIGQQIGDNKQFYPTQIANLRVDLQTKAPTAILSELFSIAIKQKTTDLTVTRVPLMESFYLTYLNTMADEVDNIRNSIKLK